MHWLPVTKYHSDCVCFAAIAAQAKTRAAVTGYISAELAAGFKLAVTPSMSIYGEVGKVFNAGDATHVSRLSKEDWGEGSLLITPCLVRAARFPVSSFRLREPLYLDRLARAFFCGRLRLEKLRVRKTRRGPTPASRRRASSIRGVANIPKFLRPTLESHRRGHHLHNCPRDFRDGMRRFQQGDHSLRFGSRQ
ncbi:hypothetical protein J2X90_005706 [Variovorax paradoxus]|uniref:hypothetical protein n=1 Tax=Variovorax paradoxus TaxID=34073 RepID=UPI00278180C1|nr:hypothetical protein [Variovorax paradoxus]MDQ0027870.1 hypothetical protein [Variovorax paradoxus]